MFTVPAFQQLSCPGIGNLDANSFTRDLSSAHFLRVSPSFNRYSLQSFNFLVLFLTSRAISTASSINKTTFLKSSSTNPLKQFKHRLITTQKKNDKSSFQDLGFFFYHNNPRAEPQRSSAQVAHALSLSFYSTLPARNSFGLLPQGYCEQINPKS